MSPRAAWRLESLGFTQVFDYVPGEADWFASGLPRAGRDVAIPRAGDVVRRDAPTCQLADRIGEVRVRVSASGWDGCLVVNAERVVLGRLRRRDIDADPEATAEQVMEPGPTTFRPDVRLSDVVDRMRERGVDSVVITNSDGRLVGILERETAGQGIAAGSSPAG